MFLADIERFFLKVELVCFEFMSTAWDVLEIMTIVLIFTQIPGSRGWGGSAGQNTEKLWPLKGIRYN